ncbi:SOS response-associated peptidase [Alicyclobacillus sp. ALC3]|uniref:SOS response-associated peptidase n=1 Tax=Alicyclobacillus sp. ALC3 TaxID=2796143 RepID=UPI003083AF6F
MIEVTKSGLQRGELREMCGRFTLTEDWTEIIRSFGLVDNGFRYPPHYNIAPSQNVVAIVANSDGERRAGLLKWGLIPSSSDSPKTTFSTFNARSETLLKNGTWKRLVPRKRCIIPADGFYEWRKSTKRPLRIQLKSRKLFGLAGLYDTWTSADGTQKVSSCTIITCKPNLFMSSIHDRMPVILPKENEDLWLDRSVTDTDLVTDMLQPYTNSDMHAYYVSPMVGNVRNDGAGCIEEYAWG